MDIKSFKKAILAAAMGLILITPIVVNAEAGNRIYLHEAHVNASSETFQREEDDGGLSDFAVWHFILNQVEQEQSEGVQLFVEFKKSGVVGPVNGKSVGKGQTWHFYVGTPEHDVLLSAYAVIQGAAGKLVLSHVSLNLPDTPPPPSTTTPNTTTPEITTPSTTTPNTTTPSTTTPESTTPSTTSPNTTTPNTTTPNTTTVETTTPNTTTVETTTPNKTIPNATTPNTTPKPPKTTKPDGDHEFVEPGDNLPYTGVETPFGSMLMGIPAVFVGLYLLAKKKN